MKVAPSSPLSRDWKKRLGISNRRTPELFESAAAVVDVPHATAIRVALTELGLSAIFCVQGVPTVAILETAQYDPTSIVGIHASLWNQGLASLLLVIAEEKLRVFSLALTPLAETGEAFESRHLIDCLAATTEVLKFQNLIHGAESGRIWRDHGAYFQPKERIDQVLLENLKAAHRLLQGTGLSSDAAQALLIQTMFIAYLEDRGIVTKEYFATISNRNIETFSDLLGASDVGLFRSFFQALRKDFNGDLFVAPCSFESESAAPKINSDHLSILRRFRLGKEEMTSPGQKRLWGYDFRYVPIELVSAVYDRFLGEREAERRESGAYYTPMFLADMVVSQVWELLSEKVRTDGAFLDPACGSGVFLVRLFQRLCEHARSIRSVSKVDWQELLTLLDQIHGWDSNGSAVRVAVFSLYVALLEELSPRDIKTLISSGNLLPKIWGKTLVCLDFFDVNPESAKFDVVIGNPPWTSRRGSSRSSVKWSNESNRPMPSGEDAWAFSWKAHSHLCDDGLVAFLLPSMGFLHNRSRISIDARNEFFVASQVRKVINFADLRRQLFDGAIRPSCLIIFSSVKSTSFPYKFEYWTPKADMNLSSRRVITLSSADHMELSVGTILENPLTFNQRLWLREPDAKLFSYLDRLPKLCSFIQDYGSKQRRQERANGQWVIGQGYQPFNSKRKNSGTVPIESRYVGTLADLPIARFTILAQSLNGLVPAASAKVRRRGFEAAFEGVRILIPRGVSTSRTRLRAAYCEKAATFQDIIQAIVVPSGHEYRAKLLTALLNSRIALWYMFHGTGSFGSERPEVKQAELLRLPFPSSDDLPDQAAAEQAGRALVAIVDEELRRLTSPFPQPVDPSSVLKSIDRLSYQYFCLSQDEVTIIEDTAEFILPAIQPSDGSFPKLWNAPSRRQRESYAQVLADSLTGWFRQTSIDTRLVAHSSNLAILRLRLGSKSAYDEDTNGNLEAILEELSSHIHRPLSGNFQLMPDLRVFVGNNLYLVKPM